MTRLFQVSEDGSYAEVESNDRLAGIGDAAIVAAQKGDGTYWYDYLNGEFSVLNIVGGELQQFDPNTMQRGEPASDYDRSRMEETVADSVTQFGMILPPDGNVGEPMDNSIPAVEEF